jgi:hypothetical protein
MFEFLTFEIQNFQITSDGETTNAFENFSSESI